MRLSIGADPEIFMTNEQGLVRSAHGVIPGTKEKPHEVPFGAIQVDGLALEFNIEPAENAFDFTRNVNTVMREMKKRLPEGYSYAIKGHHYFPSEYMEKQPDESLELGCDPDFNAYERAPNPAPDGYTTLRTAAGHLHFGWTENETLDDWFFNLCCDFVQHLDLSIGIYCYLLDKDTERKKLYGKAGAFRPKPYGLEYRTPNNAWLRNIREMKTIFELCRLSFVSFKDGVDHRKYAPDTLQQWGRKLINNEIEDYVLMCRLEREARVWLSSRYGILFLGSSECLNSTISI